MTLKRTRQREKKFTKKSKESGIPVSRLHLYRMTLRCKEIKPLESACAEIVSRAKNQGYETKGPVRIPTKILKITTRKSPCGEGSKTWDRFEMRIHKRVIDIHCPSSIVKEITAFRIDPGVDVNLVVWKQWLRAQSLRFNWLLNFKSHLLSILYHILIKFKMKN